MCKNLLWIDSSDKIASSSSNGDFQIILKAPIRINQTLALVSASIPYQYNVITGYNDKLYINGSTAVTLTQGNYTGSELASALQTALTTLTSPAVSYSTITGALTITASGAFTINMADSSQSGWSGSLLGFTANKSSATSQTGTPCDLSPIKMFSVSIDNVQALGRTTASNFNVFNFAIPVDVNSGSYATYSASSQFCQEQCVKLETTNLNIRVRMNNSDTHASDLPVSI
jgi:hypothetical protein